jgi:hypothetical protein
MSKVQIFGQQWWMDCPYNKFLIYLLEYKAKTSHTTMSIRFKIKVFMNQLRTLLILWHALFLPWLSVWHTQEGSLFDPKRRSRGVFFHELLKGTVRSKIWKFSMEMKWLFSELYKLKYRSETLRLWSGDINLYFKISLLWNTEILQHPNIGPTP